MSVDVRRLRPDDAVHYRDLMMEAYRIHPAAFTSSVDEREGLPTTWWAKRLADDPRADELVVGAWDGTRLIGAAGLRFETRPKTRHKALLYGMYVRTEHLLRGIGRRLVDAALDLARQRADVHVVMLTVTDGNRAAQRLYERCGFIAFGVEPYAVAVDDGFVSKVHMWRLVDAPRANVAR